MPDIAGLKLIVPTSVAGSGVSVSASGKVTFTSATSVSVNGCFTSSYDNYLIVMGSKSTSGDIGVRFRLRLSGTDASGNNYAWQFVKADSTTVSGSRTTSTSDALFLDSGTNPSGVHGYVYGPALAQPTALRSVTVDSRSSALIQDNAATHSLSTAYDGFSVYPASGSMTGALTVYGLSQ
jgi:hypothetical protein